MGCVRNKIYDDAERAVGAAPVEIWQVPSAGVTEGQMDFRNTGGTTIAIRLGRGKGETNAGVCNPAGPYTILLRAGDSFTEDGIVPGSIIACGDAAAGTLSTKVTYR
jgi:hypothetical protein